MRRPARIFISYAHQDEKYCARLDTHLAPLKREGRIEVWHDQMMSGGSVWRTEIEQRLADADIIVPLVSADFIASDFCFEVEIQAAFERHRRGEARIVPVILAPVDFARTPLGQLQALPPGATPITGWRDEEEAWHEVAKGIRRVIESMQGGG